MQHIDLCCVQSRIGLISGENVKTIEGYVELNFEVASFSSFRDIEKHFVTAAAEAKADIDDSIKRRRIRVSPNDLLENLGKY